MDILSALKHTAISMGLPAGKAGIIGNETSSTSSENLFKDVLIQQKISPSGEHEGFPTVELDYKADGSPTILLDQVNNSKVPFSNRAQAILNIEVGEPASRTESPNSEVSANSQPKTDSNVSSIQLDSQFSDAIKSKVTDAISIGVGRSNSIEVPAFGADVLDKFGVKNDNTGDAQPKVNSTSTGFDSLGSASQNEEGRIPKGERLDKSGMINQSKSAEVYKPPFSIEDLEKNTYTPQTRNLSGETLTRTVFLLGRLI